MASPTTDSAERPATLPRPGDLLGRYRLDREVERTEIGLHYLATRVSTGESVSIEFGSGLDGGRARAKFTRDAMIAQRLEGEHVLRVLDVGTLPNGVPWIAREPVVANVARELERRGELPVEEAVAWTLEACEAVAEAHALGMVHGDLRVENLWLARGHEGPPVIKVGWTSAVKAEGAAREDVDHDLSGLGNVLRSLVTGIVEIGEADLVPTLPNGVAHVVARATTSDSAAGARFAHLGELVTELAPFGPPSHPSTRNAMFLLSRAGIARAAAPSRRSIEPRKEAVVRNIPVENQGISVARTDRVASSRPVYVKEPRERRGRSPLVPALLAAAALLGGYAVYRAGAIPGFGPPVALGSDPIPRDSTLAQASMASDDAVAHWSRALPWMTAPAEPESITRVDTITAPVAPDVTIEDAEHGPKPAPPAGVSAEKAKTGGPPVTDTPRSASEAAGQADRERPTTSSPNTPAPAPLSPTAPAETKDPLAPPLER